MDIVCTYIAGVEYGVEVKGIAEDVLGVEQVPVAFQFSADSAEELIFIVRTIVSQCSLLIS